MRNLTMCNAPRYWRQKKKSLSSQLLHVFIVQRLLLLHNSDKRKSQASISSFHTLHCTTPHVHKSQKDTEMWWVATLCSLIASKPHTKLNKANMERTFFSLLYLGPAKRLATTQNTMCLISKDVNPCQASPIRHRRHLQDEVKPTSPWLSSQKKQIWSHLAHQIPPAVCSKTAHNC